MSDKLNAIHESKMVDIAPRKDQIMIDESLPILTWVIHELEGIGNFYE
jgi:hypothetical protein